MPSEPSLRLVPPATDLTLGEEAVDLAAGYGLTPDDWQADWIIATLGRKVKGGRYVSATSCLCVPRQNGKNAGLEIRELAGMAVQAERFLHTAHEVKTARKAFRRILGFFENARAYPELAALVKEIRKTNGQEAIFLTNGGSIEFIARSSSSGRGFDGIDVLVCDEVQELTDDEFAALLPTISAATQANPQVILTGTPPDPDKMDSAKGEVIRRIRAGAKVGGDDLCFIDFGVPDGPLPDVDDRAVWHRVNPALGGRLNIAEVERERALMSPEKFARERLGWWGFEGDGSAAFGPGKWEACGRELGKRPKKPHTLGIAVSMKRDYASVAAAAPKGSRVHVAAVMRQSGTEWVAEYVARIQTETDCMVVIDGKGPTAPLIPELERAGVRLTIARTDEVLDACGLMYDRVQQQQILHYNDPELNTSVAGAQPRLVGDSGRWAWGRRLSAGDVAMLEAATLAAWAVETESESDPSAYFV